MCPGRSTPAPPPSAHGDASESKGSAGFSQLKRPRGEEAAIENSSAGREAGSPDLAGRYAGTLELKAASSSAMLSRCLAATFCVNETGAVTDRRRALPSSAEAPAAAEHEEQDKKHDDDATAAVAVAEDEIFSLGL
ncbi:hypothetical protein ON010_g4744 [Phytophthora cinnamomi]|nr:hypothetical protein ON010_g4744 [Phytophthora cinnamomi]